MAKKQVEDIQNTIKGVERTEGNRGALWISTGSTLANIVVGAGRGLGYETGEVVLMESQSGAGKTYWAHEAVANAFHQYKKTYPNKFKYAYVDTEAGATFNSKELFGLEIVPQDIEKRRRPQTLQDSYADTMVFLNDLKPDEYGVYVTDSINGFFDEKAEERSEERINAYKRGKDYEEKTMGMDFSKYLSQTYFKGICPATERANAVVLIVAQYRQKSLPSGGTYLDLQMGEALKYYANKRVKLTIAEYIISNGREIGVVVKVETKKARGPWPYRHAFVTLYFATGIDNTVSNIEYLYDLRTAEGKLSKADKKQTLDWDGQEFTRDELVFFIEENNLEQELENRVIAKWNEAEAKAVAHLQGRKKRFE